MSYLELAKKIQAKLELITNREPERIVTDPVEEPIIAVLIDSEVLGAPVWFALRDNWKPDEGDLTPVFYPDELPFLRSQNPETLREIFKVKVAFGGGKVRQ